MKKYIFLMGIILLALIIVSIEPTYGLVKSSKNLLVNSNDLLDYIEDNHIQNIQKVCSYDFCDYLRSVNVKEAIEIFKEKYHEYLKMQTDEETAFSTIIKGFPITEIQVLE